MKALMFVSTFVLALSAPLSALAAPRPNSEMVKFFQSIQGHWAGQGSVQENVGGDNKYDRLNADVQVRHSGGYSWSISTQLTTRSGQMTSRSVGYDVRNNDLFASDAGPMYPVQLLSASSSSIAYRFYGSSVYGNPYEVTTQISAYGSSLSVKHTETSNGYTVRDLSYSLRRF